MLSRFHRKLGVVLGLFSILMAMLAPEISHVLAANRASNALTEILASASCSAQSAPGKAAESGHGKRVPGAGLADCQVCGYCNLLAHLPALPLARPVAFAATVWTLQIVNAKRLDGVERTPRHAHAQPRAPPFFS